MNMTISRLNNTEYTYFKENFIVKETNISSLEDANVILFGETHTCLEHRIKICWLLNKLACDGDYLYLEGLDQDTALNKIDFENTFQYPLHPHVKLKGWDCMISFNHAVDFFKKAALFTKWLEDVISAHESCSMSNQDKIAAIHHISLFFSRDGVQNTLDLMKKNQFSFDYDDGKEILKIPLVLNKLIGYATLAEKVSNNAIDALLFLAAHEINQIIQLWGDVELLGMNFLNRNIVLGKTIQEFNENEKFYGIAGKRHLIYKKKKEILGQKKGVEVLNEALKTKKYAVICPTKNRNNIGQLECFFGLTKLKKIMNFTKYLFSDCLTFQRTQGWITFGTAIVLAAKTEYFSYLSSLVILGSIGIATTETYFNSLTDKEICTELEENYDKMLDLDEQINRKINLIPQEILNIKKHFSEDGQLKT